MRLRRRMQLRLPGRRTLPVRRILRLTSGRPPLEHDGPARLSGARGFVLSAACWTYFFFPWFFTASIAALAASGSR